MQTKVYYLRDKLTSLFSKTKALSFSLLIIFFGKSVFDIFLPVFQKPFIGKGGLVLFFKEITAGIPRFQIVAVDILVFVPIRHGVGVNESIPTFAPVVDVVAGIGGVTERGAKMNAVVTGSYHASIPASAKSFLLNSSAVL